MKNTLLRWRATWQPDMYHGWGRAHRYFEGWYFKIVDAPGQNVFAVIPGIARDEKGRSHAFIQVLDGKNCRASYHEFPAEEFIPSENKFALKLGDNAFSAHHLELNLPELSGRLEFKGLTPWPKMLGAPGIMGWYGFVPFMQCFHGIVSLHHSISGNIKVHGEHTDFAGGTGYTEKDWGRSFPRSYIWMQTNHFEKDENMCLIASVAHIPWRGSYFIGYLVGFFWHGKLYRFATYTGAKMKAALGEDEVSLCFKDRKYRLEIIGRQGPGAALVTPLTGEMKGKVNESMQATLRVRFYKNNELTFDGNGRNSGLEIAGEVGELLTDKWRR